MLFKEGSHTFKLWIKPVMGQRWERTVWSLRKNGRQETSVILWPQYGIRYLSPLNLVSSFFGPQILKFFNSFLAHLLSLKVTHQIFKWQKRVLPAGLYNVHGFRSVLPRDQLYPPVAESEPDLRGMGSQKGYWYQEVQKIHAQASSCYFCTGYCCPRDGQRHVSQHLIIFLLLLLLPQLPNCTKEHYTLQMWIAWRQS